MVNLHILTTKLNDGFKFKNLILPCIVFTQNRLQDQIRNQKKPIKLLSTPKECLPPLTIKSEIAHFLRPVYFILYVINNIFLDKLEKKGCMLKKETKFLLVIQSLYLSC